MSEILIYAQSLKNDGNDHLLYDGKYYYGPIRELSWSKITESLQKLKKKYPTIKKDKDTSVVYRTTEDGLYFIVPSEQVDEEGRTAVISIFCPREEKDNLEKALSAFLKESSFSVTTEVYTFVKKESNKKDFAVSDGYGPRDFVIGLGTIAAMVGLRCLFKKAIRNKGKEKKDEHRK